MHLVRVEFRTSRRKKVDMKPYYQDSMLTLYCGDFMDIMPKLPRVDANCPSVT